MPSNWNSVDRQRSSKSSMSDLLSFVLPVQDKLVVRRSSSVIRFAVNREIKINRDTTSKDTIVSSGSFLSSFMCWRNVTALDTEWVDVFTSGWRMLARCFESSYVGDPGSETIGRSGVFGLWIFGNP